MPAIVRSAVLGIVFVLGLAACAAAQQAPSIGYMFPSGGQAGQTVEVVLGGYDWTPDIQVFTHDPRVKLEILGTPGPVIVPEPPYWFGKKARRSPFLLPRETRARLTIPNDMRPGVVRWQVANANGAAPAGYFVVGDVPEVVEADGRPQPQTLPSAPVTVSGQIKKIEEVDRYQFTPAKTGPFTCALVARAIGSDLNAALEVRDASGRLIADSADTAGVDLALTFAARASQSYVLSVYDVDFRGNRAFTYRLTLTDGPRVVAAIPAIGRRGESREVELVGFGVATGQARLETVTRRVAFPSDPRVTSFAYQLKTPFGAAAPVMLGVSDADQAVRGADKPDDQPQLAVPAAVTGVLEQRYAEHRYRVAGRKGDSWAIALTSQRFGAPLDLALAVSDADGKELARSDDVPGSTDAALQFAVRADGEYTISVTDASGRSGDRSAVYHLTLEAASDDFTLSVPETLAVPIGGKAQLLLKATRTPGFKDPIAVSFTGLPPGVTAPADLTMPAGKTSLRVDLTASADCAAAASLVEVAGAVTAGEREIRRVSQPFLVAATITPPFSIDAEGKDDVTKWPRGSTFPAPVLIEREAGFDGEIRLEMASKQGRHRQGIRGPELVVAPGVSRILYPVRLPEWLETTRTSRMVVNGVAHVADPQGNVRYSLTRQKTRMGFLPTGALLKIAADETEFGASRDGRLVVPLTISRAERLVEPVTLELRLDEQQAGVFYARAITLGAEETHATLPILVNGADPAAGEFELTIRATVMQDGKYPVIAETSVLARFKKNKKK